MLSTRGELGYVITDVAGGGLTADLIDKLQRPAGDRTAEGPGLMRAELLEACPSTGTYR